MNNYILKLIVLQHIPDPTLSYYYFYHNPNNKNNIFRIFKSIGKINILILNFSIWNKLTQKNHTSSIWSLKAGLVFRPRELTSCKLVWNCSGINFINGS
jgi:hypothetical protein